MMKYVVCCNELTNLYNVETIGGNKLSLMMYYLDLVLTLPLNFGPNCVSNRQMAPEQMLLGQMSP